MAGQVTSKPKAAPKKTAPKKATPKPAAKKKVAPAKPKTQEDKPAKATQEKKERSGFGGFLDSVQGAFGSAGAGLGKLHASTKPLDFNADEKKDGLKAADTMDKLAGPDGKWDRNDLANNFAQLPKPGGGLKGIADRTKNRVVQNKFFDQHNVPDEERSGIIDQSRDIKEKNPEIDALRNYEKKYSGKYDGFSDEQRAKYDATVEKHSSALREKGLLPVEVSDLQQMGGASDVLQEKLSEAGLPKPEPGTPVDAGQYRGLFEGKSPLRTQTGF